MVMEVGKPLGRFAGLGATRWTSTVPTPFGPAPGGGRFGEVFSSGFAAEQEPVIESERGQKVEFSFDDQKVAAKTGYTVKKEPSPGIPSIVIRLRFTDRGALTQGILDSQVKEFIKNAGYKVSRATSFKPQDVMWRWAVIGSEAAGDVPIYVPEVASPAEYMGIRYSGSAYPNPLYQPSAETLAKLPNQIWVYTVGVTSKNNTMTDGEGAQVLTLLKQAMINMFKYSAFANILATVRGCPRNVFEAPEPDLPAPVVAGMFSSLILIVAWNMMSTHVGSERL
jgi:hypothetical protein